MSTEYKPEFCHWCEGQFPADELRWCMDMNEQPFMADFPICKSCFKHHIEDEDEDITWDRLDPVEPTPETDMHTYEFVIVQLVQETRTVRVKAGSMQEAKARISDGEWDEDDGVDDAELHAHNDNTILSEREVKQ